MTWSEWADDAAAAIHAAHQWRSPRTFDARATRGVLHGRNVVQFASNDYLGLTVHPAVVAAAHAALDAHGAGSGSARLIVGARPEHEALELELAAWKHAEAAVLFPTGFAANLGVLTTFGGPDVLICSDELNHASIIDGCRLARAESVVFPHRDLDALATLLDAAAGRRCIVVSDTVFSMDGDVADVAGLVEVSARHGALLVLDEAHGVLGPDLAVPSAADVLRVGTASKTLGALGGFVVGDRRYTDLLVNRARSYIFTTAPTPADTAAALASVQLLRSETGADLVADLRARVDQILPGHPSPIIPVICGESQAALDASLALLDRGLLVPAIRPPTVAPGSARLRISVCATHTEAEVAQLLDALGSLGLLDQIGAPC